jgi:hypothetical protein
MRPEIVNFLKQARRPPRLEVERQIRRGCVALALIFSMLFAMGAIKSARADSRPPPVPARGGLCPSGFTYSPTSNFCTPNPGTRSNTVPKQGYAPCPPGCEVFSARTQAYRPQSSSASRFTASHAGFLHLSQSAERA